MDNELDCGRYRGRLLGNQQEAFEAKQKILEINPNYSLLSRSNTITFRDKWVDQNSRTKLTACRRAGRVMEFLSVQC